MLYTEEPERSLEESLYAKGTIWLLVKTYGQRSSTRFDQTQTVLTLRIMKFETAGENRVRM